MFIGLRENERRGCRAPSEEAALFLGLAGTVELGGVTEGSPRPSFSGYCTNLGDWATEIGVDNGIRSLGLA